MRPETDKAIDAIEELLAKAKPVRMKDQVRVDVHRMQLLLYDLRQSLTVERRGR